MDQLLGAVPGVAASDILLGAGTTADQQDTSFRLVSVEQVVRGRFQPRNNIDEASLQSLAESIQSQGVMQPVIVRPQPPDQYEIIAGERRWRAARLAKLKEIPVLIRDLSDQQAYTWALVENIQRENLNAVEEARAMRHLIDESGLTHANLAKTIGKSRASITNTLRLLRLAPEVLTMIEEGAIEMGHARTLLAVPALLQYRLARRVEKEGLSVRQTERLAKAYSKGLSPKRQTVSDPDTDALARDLSDQLGAQVRIVHKKSGAGHLTIQYGSVEELEGVLARIRGAKTRNA